MLLMDVPLLRQKVNDRLPEKIQAFMPAYKAGRVFTESTFESLPQFCLQLRIYFYLLDSGDENLASFAVVKESMLNSPIRCLPHQSLYASLSSLETLFSYFTCDETNNELVVVMQFPGCVPQYHTQRYEDATGTSFIKGNYDVMSLKDAFETKVNATMADGGL